MNAVTMKVQGRHCDGCAATIQALLERYGGAGKAAVSFKEGEARMLYYPHSVTEGRITATIVKGGFRVTGRSDG